MGLHVQAWQQAFLRRQHGLSEGCRGAQHILQSRQGPCWASAASSARLCPWSASWPRRPSCARNCRPEREFKRVQESSREFKGVQESSREFKRVQESSRELKRVQESSREFKRVQESSRGFQRVQASSREFQRVQESSRECQGGETTKGGEIETMENKQDGRSGSSAPSPTRKPGAGASWAPHLSWRSMTASWRRSSART